jgi:hypothetical protein
MAPRRAALRAAIDGVRATIGRRARRLHPSRGDAGRTGAAFAAERFGIVPGMLTFAKGVTSAYVPLGGLMVRESLAKTFDTKAHEPRRPAFPCSQKVACFAYAPSSVREVTCRESDGLTPVHRFDARFCSGTRAWKKAALRVPQGRVRQRRSPRQARSSYSTPQDSCSQCPATIGTERVAVDKATYERLEVWSDERDRVLAFLVDVDHDGLALWPTVLIVETKHIVTSRWAICKVHANGWVFPIFYPESTAARAAQRGFLRTPDTEDPADLDVILGPCRRYGQSMDRNDRTFGPVSSATSTACGVPYTVPLNDSDYAYALTFDSSQGRFYALAYGCSGCAAPTDIRVSGVSVSNR